MPNHVYQRLSVTGSPSDVVAFIATARAAAPNSGDAPGSPNYHPSLDVSPLEFHAIAPLPDSYSEQPYSDHGYDLCREWWGTKWGAYDQAEPQISPDGSVVRYDFTCAWAPPVRAIQRASLRFKSLRFWLSWGGEGPCRGRHTFVCGQVGGRGDVGMRGHARSLHDIVPGRHGRRRPPPTAVLLRRRVDVPRGLVLRRLAGVAPVEPGVVQVGEVVGEAERAVGVGPRLRGCAGYTGVSTRAMTLPGTTSRSDSSATVMSMVCRR
jgi:hypothetical protein